MVGRQSSIRSSEGINLRSLREQIENAENAGRSRPIPEDSQSAAREGPSWVVPESANENEALDGIEEEQYEEDDASFEGPTQDGPFPELPRVLTAGVGGRLHTDSEAVAATEAAGPRATGRPAPLSRVLRRPSQSAAVRARLRLLERNIQGIQVLATRNPEAPAPNPRRVAPINVRQSSPHRNRGPSSRYPRFETSLLERLLSGRYDPDAIEYYLGLASLSAGSRRITEEFGDLGTVLKNDARPSAEGTVRQEWTPTKVLGAGSYGEVILWQRAIGTEMKVQSLVCKTTAMDSWFRDFNEEALLTQKLNATGCRNVVKVYDWNRKKKEDLARIIYEFCPFGDLQMLMDFYTEHRLVFPEAFLWHVFNSIATAICYCARGTTDDEPVPGWSEIVHKDLKPNNIFLAYQPDRANTLYPILKVADFGLAYEIPNEKVRQFKRAYRSLGNIFGAPEIREEIRSDPNQTPYEFPSPRLDIYSLGVIMLLFLRMPQRYYSRTEWECLDLDLDYSQQYYPYSQELVSLARQCVHKDAMQRPDPFTLYQVTRATAERMINGTQLMRQAAYAKGAAGGVYNGKVLWFPPDQERFTTTDTYRHAFRAEGNWFGRHAEDMLELHEAAKNPQCPPQRGLVGIGHGLGSFGDEEELRRDFAGVPFHCWLRRFREQPGDNGVPNLQYIGQDRLVIPEYDELWRAHIRGVGGYDEPVAMGGYDPMAMGGYDPMAMGGYDPMAMGGYDEPMAMGQFSPEQFDEEQYSEGSHDEALMMGEAMMD